MDQRKKLIVGGIVAVVLIVVAVVVWPRHKSAPADCHPSKDKPKMGKIEIKNIATLDKTTLVNLAGYVELIDKDNGGYLPIVVDSVEVVQQPDQSKLVTLTSSCATLEIYYIKTGAEIGAQLYQFNSINMLVKNDATKDEKPVQICDFDRKFTFLLPLESRYSCQSQQIRSCSTEKDSKKVRVADLVLKSFDLELDSDSQKAGQGLFSKDGWVSSCQAW
jgi:hypothetical protein